MSFYICLLENIIISLVGPNLRNAAERLVQWSTHLYHDLSTHYDRGSWNLPC